MNTDSLVCPNQLLAALDGNLNGFIARLAQSADHETPRAFFFEPTHPTDAGPGLSPPRPDR